MRSFLQKISTQRRYEKLVYWSKLVTLTGFAQGIIQVFGFLSGILIIRLLPVQEYAFYTLANTMLGSMTVLADSGIATGVMAEGGKVWRDKEKSGMVLVTGLELRKKFALGSLVITIPLLAYLLWHHQAHWLTVLLIVLALIPSFFAALSDSLLQTIPKLHQDIKPLQKNQVSVSLGRLLLSALTLFVFPWAFVALLANGIPRIYGNIQLRKIAYRFAQKESRPSPEIKKAILKIVKGIMPGVVYYCVSGQITIWLISVFSTTQAVAEIGALSRLAMLLSIFSIMYNTILSPRFARLPENRVLLLNRFSQIMLLSLLLFVFIIVTVYLFPDELLKILGSSYTHLNTEVVLLFISSCFNLLTGVVYNLMTVRGWILKPYISISVSVLSIIACALLLDLSALTGVLTLYIIVSATTLIMYVAYFLIRVMRLPKPAPTDL